VERPFSTYTRKTEVIDMQNVEMNVSTESATRPFARIVASESVYEDILPKMAAKGCYLSSGTSWNPRDLGDDGT